jgi:2,2-dialkylglycine decarboxylase (pyruvate)
LSPTVNPDRFWQTADRHLIRYAGGGAFCNRIIVKAQGAKMWDHEGNQIIDWTSGQMSSMLGHGHPEIVQTVTDLISTLDHLFSGFVTKPVVDAAEMLASLLPPSLSKISWSTMRGYN